MLRRSCRTFVAALSASAAVVFAPPAWAAPTRAVASVHPPEIGAARTEPGGPARPGFLFTPLQPRPLGAPAVPRTIDAVPVHAAPVVSTPFVPVRAFPGFWPQQLGFASMFAAGADLYACGAARSTLFLPALPPVAAAPFASPACGRDWSAGGDADGLTTLVSGHNKDALYGPAYNPHDFGGP